MNRVLKEPLWLLFALGVFGASCGRTSEIDLLPLRASAGSGAVPAADGGAPSTAGSGDGEPAGAANQGGATQPHSCGCGDLNCTTNRLLHITPTRTGGVVPWSAEASFDGEFTLEAWVYVLEANGHLALNKFRGGKEDIVLRLLGGTSPSVAVYVVGAPQVSFDVASPLPLRTWHHLALVHSLSQTTLFVDGEPAGQGASGKPAGDSLAPLTIGGSTRAPGFDGYLTEVRFSRGGRYEASFIPAPRLEVDATTLGLWRLREGDGGTLCDAGPFAMHGTVQGLSWEDAPSLP